MNSMDTNGMIRGNSQQNIDMSARDTRLVMHIFALKCTEGDIQRLVAF
jgi:hypothetical protein